MEAVWPIVLLAAAGIMAGGALSLYRQGAGRVAVGIVGVLGLLAGIGGVLWLIPET